MTEFNIWQVHPDFTVKDWQAEVAADNTRRGYWEWVRSQIEQKEDDERS